MVAPRSVRKEYLNRWALSGYVMENGKMSIIQYSNAKKSITCRVYAILLNLPEISKGPLDHKINQFNCANQANNTDSVQ